MSQYGAKSRVILDPFRFAADYRSIEGEIPVQALERLADQLVEHDGVVGYRIDGTLGDDRKPRLSVTIEGLLKLRCQRCLGGYDWKLDVVTVLQPVRPGQEIPDDELEDDEVDAIEIDGELDVPALVEDEILLALPIAPRHVECEPPRPEDGAEKESPFSVLAGLRGRK